MGVPRYVKHAEWRHHPSSAVSGVCRRSQLGVRESVLMLVRAIYDSIEIAMLTLAGEELPRRVEIPAGARL
jgi:hypothetical protein